MSITEMKLDAIMRHLTADNNQDREQAMADMRSLMQDGRTEPAPMPKKSVEDTVLDIMTEMGVPAHIKGHDLMAAAIVAVIDDPSLKHDITGGLYPLVAKKFNDTKSRVERAIRHAIEVTFDRCSLGVIDKYFGNTISPNSGKPTNSEFIAQIAMYVTRRLRDVA
jgi:two-component system response regulator (stage 0 sporulation protein A)